MVNEQLKKDLEFLKDLEETAYKRLALAKDECYCQNIEFVEYEKVKEIVADIFTGVIKAL